MGLSHKKIQDQRKEWASQVAAQVRMTNLRETALQKFLPWSWDMSDVGQQWAQYHLVIQAPSLAVEHTIVL